MRGTFMETCGYMWVKHYMWGHKHKEKDLEATLQGLFLWWRHCPQHSNLSKSFAALRYRVPVLSVKSSFPNHVHCVSETFARESAVIEDLPERSASLPGASTATNAAHSISTVVHPSALRLPHHILCFPEEPVRCPCNTTLRNGMFCTRRVCSMASRIFLSRL